MRDDSFMTIDINVYRKFVERSQSKIPLTLSLSSASVENIKVRESIVLTYNFFFHIFNSP